MTQDSCTATYFTPSLWKQRRTFILETLKKYKIQKVLDYGCGEGSVLSFLIPPSATDDIHFTHLMGIDIDQRLLEEATLAACRPWVSDYEQLREAPLTVDIYAGSVDQFDDRFMMTGCDDAIICSEVIEHVYPDTLKACLPLMLGVYAPSLVIVTTPNAEYNTFFPDLQYGAPGATFRHDDHKFEWTRQQFEEWCIQGAKEYGYDVFFHGIGLLDGKHDQLDYGHCTQACIFTKQKQKSSPSNEQQQRLETIRQTSTPHTLLERFEFPYYDLPPLPENEIFRHVESYVAHLCQALTLQHHYTTQESSLSSQKDDTIDDELDSPTWSTENYDFCGTRIDNKFTDSSPWGAEYTYTNQPDMTINDERCDHQSNSNGNGDSSSSSDSDSDSDSDTNGGDEYNSSNNVIRGPMWTMTPITLKLDTLWSILHIRQLCTTKRRLVEVLRLDQSSYKVMDDQMVVHKSFKIEDQASSGLVDNK